MEKERIESYIITPKGMVARVKKICSYPNLGILMDKKNITISMLAVELNYEEYIVRELMAGYQFWNLRDMLKIKKMLDTELTLDELFYSDWKII